MNPDGTQQMVFYGNMHPRIVMIDAKPIPGSEQSGGLLLAGAWTAPIIRGFGGDRDAGERAGLLRLRPASFTSGT